MTTSCYSFNTLPVNPVDRSVTRLCYVSEIRCGGERNLAFHPHPCTELLFITEGEGSLRLSGQEISLAAGDALILNSGGEHTAFDFKDAPLAYIAAGVDGLEALSGDSAAEEWTVVHCQSDREAVLFCLQGLLREMEGGLPGYDTVCRDLLDVLLLYLMRCSQFEISFVPSSRKSSREAAITRRYIDSHFRENLTLDILAEAVHVSKYYLVHSFSREYGTSPINYLISRRIQESMHLLTETGMSLAEIAGNLGFSSPSYFSQSFRKVQGVSPLQYRIRNREEKKKKDKEKLPHP